MRIPGSARALLVLIALLVVPSTTAAQFNLLDFGLGAIQPFTAELDGNPHTTEWMALRNNEIWVIAPSGCKERIDPAPPQVPGNWAAFWIVSIQRVNGRDHLVFVDLDTRDGLAPFDVQPIRQGCYR
jgi:hypothetical protein